MDRETMDNIILFSFFFMHMPLPFLHHISHIPHGLDHGSCLPQLLAQCLDVHVQGPGFPLEIHPPHTVQDHIPL